MRTFLIGPYRRPRRRAARTRGGAKHDGVSLIEVLVVMTVIGVLISMAAPSLSRSIEQSHADIAGANLKAIWGAERLYWLENRAYTADLSELQSLGLLDPTIVAGSSRYTYAVTFADESVFTAAATRTGSDRWSGQFVISENGIISGAIAASGAGNITPGFQ